MLHQIVLLIVAKVIVCFYFLVTLNGASVGWSIAEGINGLHQNTADSVRLVKFYVLVSNIVKYGSTSSFIYCVTVLLVFSLG